MSLEANSSHADATQSDDSASAVAQRYFKVFSRQRGFQFEYIYPTIYETRAEALGFCREWNAYWQGEIEFWVVQYRVDAEGNHWYVRSYHPR